MIIQNVANNNKFTGGKVFIDGLSTRQQKTINKIRPFLNKQMRGRGFNMYIEGSLSPKEFVISRSYKSNPKYIHFFTQRKPATVPTACMVTDVIQPDILVNNIKRVIEKHYQYVKELKGK